MTLIPDTPPSSIFASLVTPAQAAAAQTGLFLIPGLPSGKMRDLAVMGMVAAALPPEREGRRLYNPLNQTLPGAAEAESVPALYVEFHGPLRPVIFMDILPSDPDSLITAIALAQVTTVIARAICPRGDDPFDLALKLGLGLGNFEPTVPETFLTVFGGTISDPHPVSDDWHATMPYLASA